MDIPKVISNRKSGAFEWLLPLMLVCLSISVFLPAARFGFINWDDPSHFKENLSFRGLSVNHFKWFFTTYHMAHYQPLNWITFAIDHHFSGLDAGRFHLTQVMLHAMAVLCVYYLVSDFLVLTIQTNRINMIWGAFSAALIFAVHPLRVESVAWLSARTDLLATIFSTLCVITYLRWAAGCGARWWWCAFTLFVAAILSKEIAIVLPAVLFVIDVYPLRRVKLKALLSREGTSIWQEKLPFLYLSALGAINAVMASRYAVEPWESTSASQSLARMTYSFAFYPLKMFWPVGLSPLYEIPGEFGWRHTWVISAFCLLSVGVAVMILLRRRYPGMLAAFICYLILILPVSGIVQRGSQLVADRYSYVACLPLIILAGWCVSCFLQRQPLPIVCLVLGIAAILFAVTEKQISYWRDSTSLWARAIELDNHNGKAHASLGHALQECNRFADALSEYEIALRIRPTQQDVHFNMASILFRQGRDAEAVDHYLVDLQQNPLRAGSHFFLGTLYERMGNEALARKHYWSAVETNPDDVLANLALARLFLTDGQERDAESRLRNVLSIVPNNTTALELLAQLCGNTQRKQEAITLYDRLIVEFERLGKSSAVIDLKRMRDKLAANATSQNAGP